MPKEILIVDDEPSIVVPIQFLMEQQGYNVIVAKNGEDALDIILKYKPDLILLDIMLPGIDGYEVCEIVRLNPDYIIKPFSNAEVVAKVKELLENTHEKTGT
jgi:DNA-binding response OmpR family regulator